MVKAEYSSEYGPSLHAREFQELELAKLGLRRGMTDRGFDEQRRGSPGKQQEMVRGGQSLSIIQDSIGESARVEKILGVFRNSVLRRGVEKRLPRIMTWCQWLLAKLPILNHKKEDDEPWDCET
ncbi:hypothetical protein CIRG_09730 [Coccidioides immitis RMSCC 2394]|uniref:Uncharacterized protein n=1 Tax=Coccidioides immitis RMSCC 2394 TaxID=404692 RepID=A0A0J6YPC1_COCIT|nr:hypothetical protein CIRG_09730 [Coccidioides immitis RMSCC 2394]